MHRLLPSFAVVGFALSTAVSLAPTGAAAAEAAPGPRCRWGDPAVLPGQPAFDEAAFIETLSPCKYGREFDSDRPSADGLLWMAIPVPRPERPLRDPALFFPGVSGGAIEVYSSGNLEYRAGVIVPGGWVKPPYQEGLLIPIPTVALGGTLLVRIQATIAIKVEAPRLGERAELLAGLGRKGLPSVMVGTLAVLIGLVFLGFSIARRERTFLGFTGMSLSTGLYILFEDDFLAALFGAPRAMYYGVMLAAFLIPPSLVGFVSSAVSSRRRPWLVKLGYVATFAAVLCSGLILSGAPMFYVLFPWAFLAFPVAVAASWVSLVEARQGNREARYFVVGMGIFLVSIAIELVTAFTAGRNGGVFVLGAAASITANMAILVRRYVLLSKKSRDQAELLGAREADVRRFAEDLGGWAKRLGEAVTGLRNAAASQADALGRQSQALVEAQATTSEIGQASSVAKSRAESVLGGAARAEAAGKASDEAISATFSGLDAVKVAVGATAHQAASLGAQSEELVGVVAAVKDLAAQSRLMALNAGLEAARAGEMGRGFGVVARELRRLAEASSASAEQVSRALKDIHHAVTETVRLADGGAREVESVVARIRSSGDQLREIANIATAAGAEARDIATAISQQDTGVHEVLEALRVLDTLAAGTGQAQKDADDAAARVQDVVAGLLAAAERARSV
ncbi:MAG: methyl-accepting chemotaxis protein [Myxococcales bacterium]